MLTNIWIWCNLKLNNAIMPSCLIPGFPILALFAQLDCLVSNCSHFVFFVLLKKKNRNQIVYPIKTKQLPPKKFQCKFYLEINKSLHKDTELARRLQKGIGVSQKCRWCIIAAQLPRLGASFCSFCPPCFSLNSLQRSGRDQMKAQRARLSHYRWSMPSWTTPLHREVRYRSEIRTSFCFPIQTRFLQAFNFLSLSFPQATLAISR